MGFKALVSGLLIQQSCLVLPIWSKESIAHDGHWTGIVPVPPQLSLINDSCFSLLSRTVDISFKYVQAHPQLLRNSPDSNHRECPSIRGLWNWKPILLTIPFHSSVNFDVHSAGSTILRLLYPDKHTEDGTRRLLKSSEKRGLSRWGYLGQ
jgi:hypothetical protein